MSETQEQCDLCTATGAEAVAHWHFFSVLFVSTFTVCSSEYILPVEVKTAIFSKSRETWSSSSTVFSQLYHSRHNMQLLQNKSNPNVCSFITIPYRGGRLSFWNPWVKLAFKNTHAHLVSRMCCQGSEGSSKNCKAVKVLWRLTFITTENICWKNLFGSCSVGYNVNVLCWQLLLWRSHCKRKDTLTATSGTCTIKPGDKNSEVKGFYSNFKISFIWKLRFCHALFSSERVLCHFSFLLLLCSWVLTPKFISQPNLPVALVLAGWTCESLWAASHDFLKQKKLSSSWGRWSSTGS